MNKYIFAFIISILILTLAGCSTKIIHLTDHNLNVINRDISSIDKGNKAISLNDKPGDGIAIIEDVAFDEGIIEVDIKGENIPGKSFVGIAFNIQNDSTYEAIYFRPFNFQSKEKIRREHSVQYISHPKNNWRYLRTNFEGQFEAEYERQPSPDDWFTVKLMVEEKRVSVYDSQFNKQLLSVERLENQMSNKMGLWAGNNSKGAFRNLRIENK